MILLIMAGGMGSRFGGIKQIEPVGKNNELVIDYSIYDAIKAGFSKVVFVIRKEIEEPFRERIFNRIQKHIKAEIVYQPEALGTAHAILCAKDAIKEPFCTINADDFYGRSAFVQAANFLKNLPKDSYGNYAIVVYKLKTTVPETGSVSRGICSIKDGNLAKITECTVDKSSPDYDVSMNVWGFTPDIFPLLEEGFNKFLKEKTQKEFGISNAINNLIHEINVKVLTSFNKWLGIKYKEDKEVVVREIQKLTDSKIYPAPLWKK